jgi:phospho-N-acetylmuramoyl-pentapeptide-transferase
MFDLPGGPLTRMFIMTALAFAVAMAWTPILTHFLYKWKAGKTIREGKEYFSKMHAQKAGTPTMGGLLVWVTALVLTVIFNFSREQTYLPLFALGATAILGAVDDILNIKGVGAHKGLRMRQKLIWQIVIAAIGAWWFFYKLGMNSIWIPGLGDVVIGWLYIPLVILVIVSCANAVNITDGLDGLAGGTLALSYLAFAILSFMQGNWGIAIFCGTIVGALLAFLWFNIYPARFFMGDTGSLSLGATLGVIALLTNTVVLLPIIGIIFVIETLSVIIQVLYRKITGGRKLFRSAPIHHHFEACGWPETKVTMRFWLIAAVFAVLGIVLGLVGDKLFK